MPKILIIRFSAMGDVAMTVPVVYSLAQQHPELEITVLSRKNFEALFQNLPPNVIFKGIDLAGYKGISGLNRLYKELKKDSFSHVADLHDVLRTKYFRFRFTLSGIKTAHIDKGKKEKKELTRKQNKVLKQLDTSFIRYRKVLEKLGFQFKLNFKSIYGNNKPDIISVQEVAGEKLPNDKWVAIAPFAKHNGKIYPLELQEKVIEALTKRDNLKIFLFGGGKSEKQIVDGWVSKYPSLISVIGKINLNQELVLLSHMDLALSMDSANMHLSSLVGTPVLSIWGATHPYAGFLGWGQKMEDTVETNLHCRPCSIFGQKPCCRGDYACMYDIKPETILKKINDLLA